jgi:hypothetical protein
MVGPLTERSPQLRTACPACHAQFRIGDYVTLVPLGPGDDPVQRRLAAHNEPYEAAAVEAHYACATGVDPITMDPEVRQELKDENRRLLQQVRDENLIFESLPDTERSQRGPNPKFFTLDDVQEWVRREQ